MAPIPIIILNWHGLRDTIECIESLLVMDVTFEFRIILVDNASSKKEQNQLKKLYQDHPLIVVKCNEVNKGFTKGNNDEIDLILKQAQTPEFVVLLNNDTVVTPCWLNALVEAAIENGADMVSSKMVNYYDRRKIDNLGHYMLNTGEILPLVHDGFQRNYNEVIENLGACGGAALYRVSMIQDIGFFDSFFDTGYEDAEYGLRAKLLGFKCIMAPNALVYHKVSQSIQKIRDDRYMQGIQINIFYSFFKLMPRRFLLFNIGFVLLKYLMWFFIGLFTLQIRLVLLYGKTVTMFFTDYLSKTIVNRKMFYEKYGHRIRYKYAFIQPTVFFFPTDLRRAISKIK